MFTAKFVRLDMPWSATPQPIRRAASRARGHSAAIARVLATALAGKRVDTERRERRVGLAAQHLVNGAGRQEFLDPAQPHEAGRREVGRAEPVRGVCTGELLDSALHPPTKLQLGKGLVELR